MKIYKILNRLRKIYWFILRPKTVGVKCLIENSAGEYLLIKTTYSGNYWSLPGGGVKRGESFENAVTREVSEEVGINVIDLKFVGSYSSDIEYKRDTIHLVTAKVCSYDFNLNQSEISEARWFPKNQMPNNVSRSITETLSRM